MKKISINDLHKIKNLLKGYKIIFNQDGIVKFQKKKDIKEFELSDYIRSDIKLSMPNYNNSILNIDASISTYFGIETKYKTYKPLDEVLSQKKYKHIAIMILDGMGSHIINNNLADEAFIKNHKVCDLNAVFPPTTACAIPAVCSGLAPVETGWVGWSNYFSEIDRFVVMFRNREYYSDEVLDINVSRDILPYKKFYEDFDAYTFDLGPSFTPSNCKTLEEMCDKYVDEIKKHKSSFCYMYWDNPDIILHENGSYSIEAKTEINNIDQVLAKFEANLPNDTLVIVTADHGHIDVKPIYLANYFDLLGLLERMPSNEGRCAFFKVNKSKKKKFSKLFNEYFSDYFTLIEKDDFISEGYLGDSCDKNYKLDSFIGDFVAIAKKNYYFNFDPFISTDLEDKMVFKSHHAGITENEMLIPFIVIKK